MQQATGIAVRWRNAASIVVAAGLLLSCGGDDDSGADVPEVSTTSSGSGSGSGSGSDAPVVTPTPTEPPPDVSAPEETTGAAPDSIAPSTSSPDAPGGGVGQAVVDVDADRYEFIVIQCLRDVTGPLSDTVIEFQLDAVPAATPADTVESLLGVIGEDVDVFAQLAPVVEFGPILSITQVAGGGEALYVTDLDTIEITSDGDPTDPASRSLDVSSDPVGARVTGTTTADGRSVTVDATCP